jgi:ribosomal subunit interface protein
MQTQERETSVVIHFNHMSTDDDVREHLQERCDHLAAEFPETAHYELSLTPDASEIRADAHASGRGTHIAAHASHDDLRQAGDAALNKLEKELRRHHDKRIFARRREAQKQPGKKKVL